MRVAHLLRKYDPRAWGGTETAVRDLFAGLRAGGVSSVVYAPKIDGHRAVERDPLAADGLDVRRYRAFVPALGLSREARGQLVAVGGNLMSFALLGALLREPGLAVIHTHVLQRLGGIARTVARARRIPFVVTIHGGYRDLPARVREELARPLRGGFEYGRAFGALLGARRVVRDADAVITCNPREAELVRGEVRAERIHYVPHGVPTETFSVDWRADADPLLSGLDADELILCVGRIDAVKNQGALVEALHVLREKRRAVALVLVGAVTDATYGAALERRVEKLGLAGAVRFVGALPPRDPRLVGLYQRADVVALPSLSETFGIVILEAWAAGACVVASRTSGASELVRDGANGVLHDIDDCDGLVDALDRVLSDETLARKLASAGRAKALSDYDYVAVAGRVLDVYRSLGAA